MKDDRAFEDLMKIYKMKTIAMDTDDDDVDEWLWDEDPTWGDEEEDEDLDFESIATRLMDELAAHNLDVLVAIKDTEIGEWWASVTKHRRIIAERERQREEERRRLEEDERARKELLSRLTPEEKRLLGI